ncbi:MAG: bifunctional 4-hydroxy-2-oxoglutarate aldolase/2-dehydro-3-deoxy-phosphogluconate aldolase [Christensenellales bacterium]
MSNQVAKQILDGKIVAIVRGVKSDRIVDTAKALKEGGISLLEVTFDQTNEDTVKDTLKSLALLTEKLGDKISLGAGTVMSPQQAALAARAGAGYIISPNVNVGVIEKTKELGLVSIPGAFTPSEAVTAFEAGADFVKLFPAGILGTAYIKALLAPLGYIPVLAVGGVNVNNVKDFLKAGCKGVGVGGNLVDVKVIYNGEYDKITAVAKSYIDAIRE